MRRIALVLLLVAGLVVTPGGAWAHHRAVEAPTANFSRTILEQLPPFLAVSRLPSLSWSDWGMPARVLQTLKRTGIAPAWLPALGHSV